MDFGGGKMMHHRGHKVEYENYYDELGLKTDDEYYNVVAEKEHDDYEEDEFM
jgi:hypothetical protein